MIAFGHATNKILDEIHPIGSLIQRTLGTADKKCQEKLKGDR